MPARSSFLSALVVLVVFLTMGLYFFFLQPSAVYVPPVSYSSRRGLLFFFTRQAVLAVSADRYTIRSPCDSLVVMLCVLLGGTV